MTDRALVTVDPQLKAGPQTAGRSPWSIICAALGGLSRLGIWVGLVAVWASPAVAQDFTLRDILADDHPWRNLPMSGEVISGLTAAVPVAATTGQPGDPQPAQVAPGGLAWAASPAINRIWLVSTDAPPRDWCSATGGVAALTVALGGNHAGRLLGYRPGTGQVVTLTADGTVTVVGDLAEPVPRAGAHPRDGHPAGHAPANEPPDCWLASHPRGGVYLSVGGEVWHIGDDATPRGRRVLSGGGGARAINRPAGLAVSPDGATLLVADAGGLHVWAYRIAADGSPGDGQPYYTPQPPTGQPPMGRSATLGPATLTVDTQGRLYATTPAGLQMFDRTGRLIGVVPSPDRQTLRHVALGGSAGSDLIVSTVQGVWVRATKAQGLRPLVGGRPLQR